MSVGNEIFALASVQAVRTEAPSSLVELEAEVPSQGDLLASVRVETVGRIALHKRSKSHPREWVDRSNPIYWRANRCEIAKSHQLQLVDCSDPLFNRFPEPHKRATARFQADVNLCRRDLNYPPTTVGGIFWSLLHVTRCRENLKHPPTPVGGILTSCAEQGRSVRDFIILAKPEITLMVMISAGVACLIASDSVNLIVLIHAVLGTGLVAAGAATLNQFMERTADGTMRRTSKRPLPSCRLTARAALLSGVCLSGIGTIYLFFFLNALTSVLGLFTLFSYLFVYTPLKRKTQLCTLLGAIPGAAPVLMGWAAARNNLATEAWALYAILFLWQFPHFYAIGWLYREDYERAGMLMLPAMGENDGKSTFRQILISAQLLIFASLALTFIAPTGGLYFVVAIILGLAFYYFAYQASISRSKLAAKRLLHASVIYLPLLYLAMLLDKLIVTMK
jgi:protoheme IX farnesyltransferase